jgi:hypothetical protein
MRSTRLVQIAAEAEGLRLRTKFSRIGRQIAFGAVAALFAVLAIVLLHVVSFQAILIALGPGDWMPVAAAGIMFAIDLLMCALFVVLAARGGESAVEQEALQVRQQAVHQMGEVLSMAVLLRPFMRYLPRRGVYGLILATLTARFLGSSGRKL